MEASGVLLKQQFFSNANETMHFLTCSGPSWDSLPLTTHPAFQGWFLKTGISSWKYVLAADILHAHLVCLQGCFQLDKVLEG